MEIKELKKKLDPKHVKQREQSGLQLSYIEGWHAIAEANRIFGYDGWVRETIYMIENHEPYENKNGKYVVSFRASVRVTVGDVIREGVGFGSGIAKSLSDAYEGALKEAETDAMKRALMTFGNPFGLALYDKDKKNVGVDKPELTEEEKLIAAQKFTDKKILEIEELDSVDAVNRWMQKNSKALNALTKYPEINDRFNAAHTALIDRINIGE